MLVTYAPNAWLMGLLVYDLCMMLDVKKREGKKSENKHFSRKARNGGFAIFCF
jgi:hypothetical protein